MVPQSGEDQGQFPLQMTGSPEPTADWPLWDEAAGTIRNYVKAEDELRAIEAILSNEERELLNLR